MNKALLDTDILSEMGRTRNQIVLTHARTYHRSFGHYTLSTVSVMEVIQGFQKKQAITRLNEFLVSLPLYQLIPFDQPAAELAGRIAGDLDRVGQPIGLADTMIAAIALTHQLELATGNSRHYDQVRQVGYPLVLVNWRL